MHMGKMRFEPLLIVVMGVTAVGHPVHADYYVSNSCSKPYNRSNEYAVDSYKDCIEDFVAKQRRAINNHQGAANNAIEEWNNFASG